MNIALLTLHAPCNFGSNLQALSLVRAFTSMGHAVRVLDYRSREDEDYYRDITPPVQREAHKQFLKEHLPLSPRLQDRDGLVGFVAENQIDMVVVGSDAVLRVSHLKGKRDVHRYGNPYWLQWIDDSPRLRDLPTAVVSGSSMGSFYYKLPRSTKQMMINSLRRRHYVSVRDYWTMWMIRLLDIRLGMSLKLSMDPVFTLRDNLDLTSISLSRFHLPEKYLLFCGGRYFSGNHEWIEKFRRFANRQGYAIMELPTPEYGLQGIPADGVFPEGVSPLEWLTLIAKSSGYVGIRFHPIVVAITFDVPFFAIDDYGYDLPSSLDANFSSKTFDLCLRCGLREFAARPVKFFRRDPESVVRSLISREAITGRNEQAAITVYDDLKNMLDQAVRGVTG